MRAIRCVLLAAAVGGLGGTLGSCGGTTGDLHGSICSVYDCGHDTVTIRNVSDPQDPPTTIQIDYTSGPVTGTVERAAVVVCDVSSFVKGERLPLSSARHIAPDGIDFPTLKEGTCTFDTDVATGAHLSGTFQAVFTTEAGTDRALYGEFQGTLEATNI
jgi:hypothetical protein